jgi:hypothetical protein
VSNLLVRAINILSQTAPAPTPAGGDIGLTLKEFMTALETGIAKYFRTLPQPKYYATISPNGATGLTMKVGDDLESEFQINIVRKSG